MGQSGRSHSHAISVQEIRNGLFKQLMGIVLSIPEKPVSLNRRPKKFGSHHNSRVQVFLGTGPRLPWRRSLLRLFEDLPGITPWVLRAGGGGVTRPPATSNIPWTGGPPYRAKHKDTRLCSQLTKSRQWFKIQSTSLQSHPFRFAMKNFNLEHSLRRLLNVLVLGRVPALLLFTARPPLYDTKMASSSIVGFSPKRVARPTSPPGPYAFSFLYDEKIFVSSHHEGAALLSLL